MTNEEVVSHLRLNRDDPTPLYYQLEQQLAGLIESGALKSGDHVPGDEKLSTALGLNRWTVRRALGRLVERGVIRRVRRGGTFVTSTPPAERDTIGFFYFAENAQAMTERAAAMQQYASRQGADFKMVAFAKDFFDRVDLFDEARRMGLRGLVVVPLGTEACRRNLLRLEEARFPYVRLGNTFFKGELRAPLVHGDWSRAMRHGLQYLRAFGHRRIGAILGSNYSEVRTVYENSMRAHGPVPERWMLTLQYDGTQEMLARLPTEEILTAYLRENPDVTAVFTTILWSKLAKVAATLGRRVPDTLSIIHLANTVPAENPMTALMPSVRPMGESAAHKLFEIIHQGPAEQEEIIQVPLDLVEGGSVSAPLIPRSATQLT